MIRICGTNVGSYYCAIQTGGSEAARADCLSELRNGIQEGDGLGHRVVAHGHSIRKSRRLVANAQPARKAETETGVHGISAVITTRPICGTAYLSPDALCALYFAVRPMRASSCLLFSPCSPVAPLFSIRSISLCKATTGVTDHAIHRTAESCSRLTSSAALPSPLSSELRWTPAS